MWKFLFYELNYKQFAHIVDIVDTFKSRIEFESFLIWCVWWKIGWKKKNQKDHPVPEKLQR